MGTKTTFVCDCCLREADSNLGWAHVQVNGASGGKQLMPDDDRDLCEICWSPLQTLMKKVHDEARAKRSSSSKAESDEAAGSRRRLWPRRSEEPAEPRRGPGKV
jgi:hypothetical protein